MYLLLCILFCNDVRSRFHFAASLIQPAVYRPISAKQTLIRLHPTWHSGRVIRPSRLAGSSFERITFLFSPCFFRIFFPFPMYLLSFAAHFPMTNYQPVICSFASENISAGSSKSTLKDDTKIYSNCNIRSLLLEGILALSDQDFLHLIAIALKL